MNTIYWNIPQPTDLAQLTLKTELLEQRLLNIVNEYHSIKLASSLAVEDMLITHLIAKHHLPIEIFTLQTGKLHAETLELIHIIKSEYNIDVQMYHPDIDEVKNYEATYGEFAFYHSIELRKKCCYIRKIEPLNRALSQTDAWITGQRREQSITRQQLAFKEQDLVHHNIKFNPIYDWSEQETWSYILTHHIPYNSLYLHGYPSIGCDPCTRPIRKNEDIRAGRWWWEQQDSKECGLHQNKRI